MHLCNLAVFTEIDLTKTLGRKTILRTAKLKKLQSRESNPLFYGYEPYVIIRFTRLRRHMEDSNLQIVSDRMVSNHLQYHYGNVAQELDISTQPRK